MFVCQDETKKSGLCKSMKEGSSERRKAILLVKEEEEGRKSVSGWDAEIKRTEKEENYANL